MAGKISHGGGDDEMTAISDINVTPFVDVVLVLLVIFMVTTPMLVREQMSVNLPKTQTGEKSANQAVTITIDKMGQVSLMEKPIAFGDIEAAIQKIVQAAPDSQAVISADESAKHGDVVRVMDAIKHAGLTHFAIQIEKQ